MLSLLWESPDTESYLVDQHPNHLQYPFFLLSFKKKINIWGYVVDMHIEYNLKNITIEYTFLISSTTTSVYWLFIIKHDSSRLKKR